MATAAGTDAKCESGPRYRRLDRYAAERHRTGAHRTRDDIDPLPRALDEIYPLPSRVPDELGALIDAVVESTRRSVS